MKLVDLKRKTDSNKTEIDLMSMTFPKSLTHKLTNTISIKLYKEISTIKNLHYIFKNIIHIFIDQASQT
jgi:hypothetical protein